MRLLNKGMGELKWRKEEIYWIFRIINSVPGKSSVWRCDNPWKNKKGGSIETMTRFKWVLEPTIHTFLSTWFTRKRMYCSDNLKELFFYCLVYCQSKGLEVTQIVVKWRKTKRYRSTVLCFAQQSAQSTSQFKFNHTLLYNMAIIKPTTSKIEWEREY